MTCLATAIWTSSEGGTLVTLKGRRGSTKVSIRACTTSSVGPTAHLGTFSAADSEPHAIAIPSINTYKDNP